MAGSVNKVILIGNLGARIPRSGAPRSGQPDCQSDTSQPARLGATRQTGERKEKTEWHRVVIFNENLCKIAERDLKKGSKVYVEGSLQTRKWQDQSGR